MGDVFLFFQKPIFRDRRLIIAIWFILPLIAGLKHIFGGINNNYLIFKYSFYHLADQVNLYKEYPSEYFDTNHYGPLFSLVIAPFALLPDAVGSLLWEVFIAATLFIAIYKLPVNRIAKVIIYWITFNALFVNAANSQTNTMIAALIIGAFVCIRSEKDFWAACFIALGLFIKLYGVVGLAFFFFSRHKIRFSAYFIFWCIVFFILPMLISSPSFIVQSYADWYESLVIKNDSNAVSIMQNISAIGMVQKTLSNIDISTIAIIFPAITLFAVQYIKINLYNDLRYQLGILASALMFVVLFSTGSETCTYIIALCGVGLWFILQRKPYSKYVISILISAILLSVLASSDLAPSYVRKEIVRPYALIALPFLITWLTLMYQLLIMKPSDSTLSGIYLEDKVESDT
jgi:hypothetical protein